MSRGGCGVDILAVPGTGARRPAGGGRGAAPAPAPPAHREAARAGAGSPG